MKSSRNFRAERTCERALCVGRVAGRKVFQMGAGLKINDCALHDQVLSIVAKRGLQSMGRMQDSSCLFRTLHLRIARFRRIDDRNRALAIAGVRDSIACILQRAFRGYLCVVTRDRRQNHKPGAGRRPDQVMHAGPHSRNDKSGSNEHRNKNGDRAEGVASGQL